MTPRIRRAPAWLTALLSLNILVGTPAVAPAQAQARQHHAHVIRWWEAAAVLGGISAAAVLDEPLRTYVQAHRSATGDDLASAARRLGQPEVYLTVSAAMILTGAVVHQPGLRQAGLRVLSSVVVAGVLAGASKLAIGRSRPFQAADAYQFKPFSGHDALPSGHTAVAFALASSLAEEIHNPWATAGLYTAATATGWSRINDDKHWLSDVLGAAAVGIASGKFIAGKWTVFHLRRPRFLVSRSGLGLGWHMEF